MSTKTISLDSYLNIVLNDIILDDMHQIYRTIYNVSSIFGRTTLLKQVSHSSRYCREYQYCDHSSKLSGIDMTLRWWYVSRKSSGML